jgi:hypothetical protein
MSIFGRKDGDDASSELWPLRFDSFSFGARAYNTLRAVVIFDNTNQLSENAELSPTGEPYASDWKDDWRAGHSVSSDRVFPPPVLVRWTSLDGVDHSAEIDLEAIFPQRLILHKAIEAEVVEDWGTRDHARDVQILLEISDRKINVYMRAWVLLKQPRDPAVRNSDSLRDLMLAWTKTY